MRARTIIALFLAAILTTLSATPSSLAANTNSEIIAQSTMPMPTGTNRCRTHAGPQYSGASVPTRHNNFAGEALASNLAHSLNPTFTNPRGNGWVDRYALQSADKCIDTLGQGRFSRTYLTAHGTRAAIQSVDKN